MYDPSKLQMRHISQHKILKTPQSCIIRRPGNIPVWSNPPILEKYLKNLLINIKMGTTMRNPKHTNAYLIPESRTERFNIAQSANGFPFKSMNRIKITEAHIAQRSLTHYGHSRSEVSTPSLFRIPKWGINIRKMPLWLTGKEKSKCSIAAVRCCANTCSKRAQSVMHSILLRPFVIVRRKAVKCRPFTGFLDQLCGWSHDEMK